MNLSYKYNTLRDSAYAPDGGGICAIG